MFWLMQALGWSLFLAIAYLARPSEETVSDGLQLAAVAGLSVGGLLGSLLLRWLYRKLQADGYGEVHWLACCWLSACWRRWAWICRSIACCWACADFRGVDGAA